MNSSTVLKTFAVTGITGQVGGVVAGALLAAGHTVRAVVRNAAKASAWSSQGCHIAVADMNDAKVVPHDQWETMFNAQGMKNPVPRIKMLDGFSAGWIEFEGGESNSVKGAVPLETVIQGLVDRSVNV